MRFTAFIACLLVAFDCVATGSPQTIGNWRRRRAA